MKHQATINGCCEACGASPTACLCDAVPRIELKTKICLVIHHRELSRRSNTGLLAIRALVNSEVRVRGERREALDLKDLLTGQYRSFLFYPSADAVELDPSVGDAGGKADSAPGSGRNLAAGTENPLSPPRANRYAKSEDQHAEQFDFSTARPE